MSPDALQGFFESSVGKVSIVIVIILLFVGILISGKNKKTDTKVMVVSAILVALSIALNQIILWKMPQGGSVTAFSMLPLAVCGYFFGVRRGVMAGMVMGLLNLIFDPFVIHPVQLFLDYPFAFGAIGIGALLRHTKGGLVGTYILGVFCRYLCAVASGIVFFPEYAPEGFNAITWSIYYNMTYLGVEMAFTLVVLAIPVVRHTISRLRSELDQGELQQPSLTRSAKTA